MHIDTYADVFSIFVLPKYHRKFCRTVRMNVYAGQTDAIIVKTGEIKNSEEGVENSNRKYFF